MGVLLTFEGTIDQCIVLQDQQHALLVLKRHDQKVGNLLLILLADGSVIADAESTLFGQADPERFTALLYRLQLVYTHGQMALFGTFANTQWPQYQDLYAIDLDTMSLTWYLDDVQLTEANQNQIRIEGGLQATAKDQSPLNQWLSLVTGLAIKTNNLLDKAEGLNLDASVGAFTMYGLQDSYYPEFITYLSQQNLPLPTNQLCYQEDDDNIWLVYQDKLLVLQIVKVSAADGSIVYNNQVELDPNIISETPLQCMKQGASLIIIVGDNQLYLADA